MRICRAFALLGLGLFLAAGAAAMERRIGARPMGLGDAYTALAADVHAINYNPAGLALQRNIEITLEYANLYPGLDDGILQENHLAYSQYLYDSGGLGLSWNNRSVSGVYTENEFLLGWALQPDEKIPLWAGATFKLFYFGYTESAALAENEYFSNQSSKMQVGMDLGAIYEPFMGAPGLPGLRAGFSVMNINQPDLGLNAEAKQPVDLRTGVAITWQDWNAAVDLSYQSQALSIGGGVERWFDQKRFGVRAGLLSGGTAAMTLTAGGSYAFDLSGYRLQLDYAFNYPLGSILETAGVHRAALDILLPLPTKAELKRLEEESRRRARMEFERNREQAYALFEKIRGKLVEMEIQPIRQVFAAEIDQEKNELLTASNFMAQDQYAAAIRILETIQNNIRVLEERFARQQGQPMPVPVNAMATDAQQTRLMKIVKTYLTRKVINYFSSRQEIQALRRKAEPASDAELFSIEMKLFESRERLVTYRDWRGFLTCLDEANQQLSDFELRASQSTAGGRVAP